MEWIETSRPGSDFQTRGLQPTVTTSRSYHSATIIKYQNRRMMMVYGGIHTMDGGQTGVIQELEPLDITTSKWYKPSSVSGEEPSPRFGHSCINIVSDKIPRKEQRLLVTSGTNGTNLIRNGRELQDLYVLTILDGDSVITSNWIWTHVNVDSPQLLPGRCHNCVQCLDKVLYFGGSGGTENSMI